MFKNIDLYIKIKIRMSNYTMYILVNSDLKMSSGKIAAQVGHVCHMMARKISEIETRSLIGRNGKSLQKPNECVRFSEWEKYSGSKKIVLKATQKEMEEMKDADDCVYVIDAGLTQVPENSLTAMGFYPSSTNGEVFKKFKLL